MIILRILDANNITLIFDSGNIVNISGNIFLYPPQGHPILYKYLYTDSGMNQKMAGKHDVTHIIYTNNSDTDLVKNLIDSLVRLYILYSRWIIRYW